MQNSLSASCGNLFEVFARDVNSIYGSSFTPYQNCQLIQLQTIHDPMNAPINGPSAFVFVFPEIDSIIFSINLIPYDLLSYFQSGAWSGTKPLTSMAILGMIDTARWLRSLTNSLQYRPYLCRSFIQHPCLIERKG